MYLSVSGYLANCSTLAYMYMEFPGSLVPRLLQDFISQLQASFQALDQLSVKRCKAGQSLETIEATEPDVWGNAL